MLRRLLFPRCLRDYLNSTYNPTHHVSSQSTKQNTNKKKRLLRNIIGLKFKSIMSSSKQKSRIEQCGCDHCIRKHWTDETILEQHVSTILQMVNKERKKVGVHELHLNDKLSVAASRQNYDLAFRQIKGISHTDTNGKNVDDRVRAAGYDFRYCAENIARGQDDCKHVMRTLMNSPGHKKNILNPESADIGIHVGRGKNGQLYWTQVFGVTRAERYKNMTESEIKRYREKKWAAEKREKKEKKN